MAVFSLVASRSYLPSDNPMNRFKGTVSSASNSTTVGLTGIDAGLVSSLNSLKSSRTITVTGSTLPVGGYITAASGTSVTLTYPYTVSSVAAGQTGDWLYWYYLDAPNEKQLPITYVGGSGAYTLNYMDLDGTTASISAGTGYNDMQISLIRTLSGTTGTIIGYSKGNLN
jgi:hypothetical protein